MKEQGNTTPLKAPNSSITERKDIEMVEVQTKYSSLVLKITNDHKDYSNVQMNGVKKSIQDLDKNSTNRIRNSST
jgi:hypothetical protein